MGINPQLKSCLVLALLALPFFTTACGSSQSRAQSKKEELDFRKLQAPEDLALKKLMWPLAKTHISQEFKSDNSRNPHDGLDLSAPKGTRIYAPADGKVVYAGHKFRGYGRMIVIEHNTKLATIFGHCQKLLVKSGQFVRRGSLIGLVGKTGRATAPHLHFEVRYNRVPVNPLDYMP